MVRPLPAADHLGRETIEQTLTFFRLPRQHHTHLKSTNMLERLNEEIRRRTYVVRIFPNTESCLRLVRALAVETMKTGWRPTATSIWTTCASTRNSHSAKPHDQSHDRPILQNLTHTTFY
ncbi:transposase-like protein [Rhizobium mongolense]